MRRYWTFILQRWHQFQEYIIEYFLAGLPMGCIARKDWKVSLWPMHWYLNVAFHRCFKGSSFKSTDHLVYTVIAYQCTLIVVYFVLFRFVFVFILFLFYSNLSNQVLNVTLDSIDLSNLTLDMTGVRHLNIVQVTDFCLFSCAKKALGENDFGIYYRSPQYMVLSSYSDQNRKQ